MLVTLIFKIIDSVVQLIFGLFPVVQLPDPVRNVMITAVGFWLAFLETFPYAQIVWHLFLWVILPFEFVMLGLKFFLGSRLPANLN